MNNLARWIQRTLASITLCLLLGVSSTAVSRAHVTLEFWFAETTDVYVETMQRIVEAYNQNTPGVTVEMTVKGSPAPTAEALQLASAGGIPPDVVYLDGYMIRQWGTLRQMLMPLDEIVPSGVLAQLDRSYIPNAQAEHTANGRWYGVPLRTDVRGLYLNMDHFEVAGLDPLRGPGDLVELGDFARKLSIQNSDGVFTQVGFIPYRNNWGNELAWLWSFGGESVDPETNRAVFTSRPQN